MTNQARTTNEIDAEDEPEDDRALRLDLVGRQRPAPGAGHQQVDVAVEVAVDRVRAARGERAADQRPDHEPGPMAQSMPGTPRVARTIAGTVVTSSSSMIRGFVRAM